MKKLKNLVVKIGTYQKNGETKNRYENIGAIMKDEHREFILLKPTFNPAGVPRQGFDSVLVSIFDDNNKSEDIPF